MPRASPKAAKRQPRAAGQTEIDMGHRIRLRRVEMEMSQEALGEAIGVSFQQIQKYEKGVNSVRSSRLEQIARTLRVPVTFFYGGNGQQIEVESMLARDSKFSMRLLRAYTAIEDQTVRRRMVTLMESVAGVAGAD